MYTEMTSGVEVYTPLGTRSFSWDEIYNLIPKWDSLLVVERELLLEELFL